MKHISSPAPFSHHVKFCVMWSSGRRLQEAPAEKVILEGLESESEAEPFVAADHGSVDDSLQLKPAGFYYKSS